MCINKRSRCLYKFITIKNSGARFVFSTAKNGLDFNKNSEEGMGNLKNLKKWFNLQSIGYLTQTHSDKVFSFKGDVCEGDALIIDKSRIGIGVFTADCVPVLLWDKNKTVAAAVHSGWKGTLSSVVGKTVDKMVKDYNVNSSDIIAYIGPHNRSCCYEVGKELIEKFNESSEFIGLDIIKNNKLDLEICIMSQLKEKGLSDNNIHSLNICSHCNEDIEFYSYRKNKENYGRMFSFIYF